MYRIFPICKLANAIIILSLLVVCIRLIMLLLSMLLLSLTSSFSSPPSTPLLWSWSSSYTSYTFHSSTHFFNFRYYEFLLLFFNLMLLCVVWCTFVAFGLWIKCAHLCIVTSYIWKTLKCSKNKFHIDTQYSMTYTFLDPCFVHDIVELFVTLLTP